jgi:hypothetical protein
MTRARIGVILDVDREAGSFSSEIQVDDDLAFDTHLDTAMIEVNRRGINVQAMAPDLTILYNSSKCMEIFRHRIRVSPF